MVFHILFLANVFRILYITYRIRNSILNSSVGCLHILTNIEQLSQFKVYFEIDRHLFNFSKIKLDYADFNT